MICSGPTNHIDTMNFWNTSTTNPKTTEPTRMEVTHLYFTKGNHCNCKTGLPSQWPMGKGRNFVCLEPSPSPSWLKALRH